MNEEISSIEILKEFAENTNRKGEFYETLYPANTIPRYNHYLRKVYIPNNEEKLSYYVAFQDSKSFGDHAVFSGIFIKLEIPKSVNIIVHKKDIIDKINPFKGNNVHKTGFNNFDSKILIKGNDQYIIKNIFFDTKIQELTIQSLGLKEGLMIALNEFNIEFIPEFKEKSSIGLVWTRQWILDTALIEKMFKTIENIQVEINKTL